MNNNWSIKKLGEIIELCYGKGIPIQDRQKDGKYIIYGANGELGRTNKYLVDGEAIIIGRKGSAGEVIRVSGKFWPSDVTYYVLADKNIDIDFLFFLLKKIDLKTLARGVKPGINRNEVYKIEVAVPPIEEQKKTVAKLEKILLKIHQLGILRQASFGQAKLVLRSALEKTFNDLQKRFPKKEIRDFGMVKGGKRLPAGNQFSESKTEYPYIRVVDFKNYSIDPTGLKYLTLGTQQQISNYTIQESDVYVSIAGTIGVVGTVPNFLNGANITENAAKIILKDEEQINKKFLVYFLDSPQGKEEIRKRTNQVGQPKLALMRIETIEVPLPDIEGQGKIVSYLDGLSEKIQKLQKLQKQTQLELDLLTQSVLQNAFGGNL